MNTYKRFLSYFLTLTVSLSFVAAQDDFSDETVENETVTISGKVTDSKSGEGIAGANITVEGSDLGAASDEDGSFSIEGVAAGPSVTAPCPVFLSGDQNEAPFFPGLPRPGPLNVPA